MDKFLEKYDLPKLNEEKAESLNRVINSWQNWSSNQKSPSVLPEEDSLKGEFYKTFQEELTPILRLFQKIKKREDYQTPFMKPASSYSQKQIKTKQENCKPISLVNTDDKILNKILANCIHQHLKKMIHHDQVGFIPEIWGWYNILKSINIIHHINKGKTKIRWSYQ